jgi:hypothetical protein
MALSDYYLFGRVKDALCGYQFADDNELKWSFCDVHKRNYFHTASHSRKMAGFGIQQDCPIKVHGWYKAF